MCVCKHGRKWVYACVWRLLQAKPRTNEALEAESAADDELLHSIVAENLLLHQALKAGFCCFSVYACASNARACVSALAFMYICMYVYSCLHRGRVLSCLLSARRGGKFEKSGLRA